MKHKIFIIFKLLRPRQWLKNFAIFASIVFTGQLFNVPILTTVCIGFVIFCLVSSAIYIVNDIFDREKDRLHPFKRFRPIAHKDIPVNMAMSICVVLIIIAFSLCVFVKPTFVVAIVIYIILQLAYSVKLKNIEILDILALAAGYMLRVYAGELVSDFRVSVWLLLTTIALSLFIAVGKRKSELTLISHMKGTHIEATRATLSHYSEQLLNVYISIFVTATFVFYSLFTSIEVPQHAKITMDILLPNFLPEFFQRKWLMVTIIPVVYGLMRYLQDIYEKHEGESPDRVLLSDMSLLTAVISWVILVIFIIYFLLG
ncbi:MAG TPA: decaprenyl-phosphate phosphoribosyltransferase [Candidatus Saccharimonadales bacterium]|nr:decaprenyl-phosphate phosphoribosyltransferase [Candidatus Saccharimonadales bacterium]